MTIEVRLFDADGRDRSVDLDPGVVGELTESQLLWVDVDGGDGDDVRRVAEIFRLERQSITNLLEPIGRPRLDVLADYFEINVVALNDDDERIELDIFAGPNWVATVHRDPVPFLGELRERLGSDTELGRLSAPLFLAALLDWQVGTFFRAVDDLERAVDVLDDRALSEPDRDDVIRDLVRVRRRIAATRRALTPHREVFAALARPDFEVIASSESAAHFRALHDRLERAIAAVENARELLIGSFDIFMTQNGQRTNDVMQLLTIVSVILLPAVVIAGVMGMNFRLGLFDDPIYFWVVLGAMAVIAVGVLVVARRQRWI